MPKKKRQPALQTSDTEFRIQDRGFTFKIFQAICFPTAAVFDPVLPSATAVREAKAVRCRRIKIKHISCIPTLRKEERRLQTIHSCVTLRRCEQGVCIEARTRTYCERIWPLDATVTMHRNVLNHGVRLAMWKNGNVIYLATILNFKF